MSTPPTTYSTDSQVDQFETMARAALSAYSAAQVRLGNGAVTDYGAQRVEAQAQILRHYRQIGLLESYLSRAAELYEAELALTLALLFESVQQVNRDGTGDTFAQKAAWWRTRYVAEIARAAPILNIKHTGRSFSMGRG